MLIPIFSLLLSTALLLLGHGLQLTLLPLRAEMEGFSSTEIGLTGSTYFLGFVIGCLVSPYIVRRVGHIRSFAVLATSYSVIALIFHATPLFTAWLVLRFFSGAAISGLYMVIESWLNERATSENRGTLLSIYTVINLLMITAGQQLLNIAPISSGLLFAVAAVLFSLAIIPVSLTLSLAPAPIHNVDINLFKIWKLSNVGVLGSVCSGLTMGAFWTLGPIYAHGIGLEKFHLTLFMSATVLGGAVFQLPLGRLSDHYDRRIVLLAAAFIGGVISILLSIITNTAFWLLLLAFLWGGCVMTLYAICLAHTTDAAVPEDFVVVGSGMLLITGLFSAIGAPMASLFITYFGPRGLFIFVAGCLFLLALSIVVRRHVHVIPYQDEIEPFRAIIETSPAVFTLDPRTETIEEQDPELIT
ncbi:MFS transporter [Dasania marina]|uniref:MFS transporter n=1 Tax=Dasania marina TaxID=471499 RepID=UPI0030D6EA23|tara:strand:- start:13405 stop:14649 length:1245 start_codon:yes stop_codon:yes gene_type:complete